MMDFDYQHQLDDRFPMEKDHEEELQEEEKPLVSTNKLKIKLKAVNDEIVQRDDDKKDDYGARNGGAWICGLCLKAFRSGKALGGHMRVHAQQPFLPAGAGGFGRRSYLQDLERDGKPTCSLCNKTFPSPKSLFGHMRCHPERDWRGMNPPEIFAAGDSCGATTPSSTIDSDQADEPAQEIDYCSSSGVDLLRYLDNWSVKKARRSGVGKSTAIDAVCPALGEDEIGAVEALMLLSTAKNRFPSIHVDDEIGDAEKPISPPVKPISSSNKNTVEIQDQNYSCDDSDNSKIQLDYEDTPMIDCTKDNTNLEIKKRKRIKTVHLKDFEEDPSSNYQIINSAPKCYRCSVCNKTFPTPQALGGHKSSAHNKPLIKISLADPELTLNGGLGVLKPHNYDDQEDHIMSTLVTPVSHICKICDKAFPSGQALGGHMRRHWQGPSPAGKMQLVVVSSDQSGSLSAAITTDDAIKEPVLGFDLNELPDADDAVEQW